MFPLPVLYFLRLLMIFSGMEIPYRYKKKVFSLFSFLTAINDIQEFIKSLLAWKLFADDLNISLKSSNSGRVHKFFQQLQIFPIVAGGLKGGRLHNTWSISIDVHYTLTDDSMTKSKTAYACSLHGTRRAHRIRNSGSIYLLNYSHPLIVASIYHWSMSLLLTFTLLLAIHGVCYGIKS